MSRGDEDGESLPQGLIPGAREFRPKVTIVLVTPPDLEIALGRLAESTREPSASAERIGVESDDHRVG